MFPGDSVNLSATLANATGYTVKSVTSSNSAVTVAMTSDDMSGGTRAAYASIRELAVTRERTLLV